jgi:hypothetical protein
VVDFNNFIGKKVKRVKMQKIDFIATGLPIMLSLPQQNCTPPARAVLRALNSVAQAPISRDLRKKYS